MNAPYTPPATTRTKPAYQTGFGNSFETEALPGALPQGRNSPQRCAFGLYAEQLSGSPFTAPRASNERSWLYRIQPSVKHMGQFRRTGARLWRTAPCRESDLPIAPLRWSPVPIPGTAMDFIEGMHTATTAGDAASQSGMAAHLYLATRDMADAYFTNADGELLILPQQGGLRLRTEFGVIEAEPGDIAVIPRGVKFAADLLSGPSRGYVCENYGSPFTLPERGPIGANCLANPRDFLTPVAAYEDRAAPCTLTVKWGGNLWVTDLAHSPLDVVAWHGQLRPLHLRPPKILPRRPAPIRPRRPLHLHHPHRSHRHPRHGQRRLRHLPGPLGRCRKHVQAPLVPFEHHERVHGPALRRL